MEFNFGSALGGFRSVGASINTFNIKRVDGIIIEGTLTGTTDTTPTEIGFGVTANVTNTNF